MRWIPQGKCMGSPLHGLFQLSIVCCDTSIVVHPVSVTPCNIDVSHGYDTWHNSYPTATVTSCEPLACDSGSHPVYFIMYATVCIIKQYC